MIDGFEILVAKRNSRESLVAALAGAYGIQCDEINLQYQDAFDLDAPERRLFCLVTESEGGEFPVLLTLSSCEGEADEDIVIIASKISHALSNCCLISSGRPYDDDTRRLINGFENPKLVLVREEYDELLQQTQYFLDGFE